MGVRKCITFDVHQNITAACFNEILRGNFQTNFQININRYIFCIYFIRMFLTKYVM